MIPTIHRELSHLRTQDLLRDAGTHVPTEGRRRSTRRPAPRTGAEGR